MNKSEIFKFGVFTVIITLSISILVACNSNKDVGTGANSAGQSAGQITGQTAADVFGEIKAITGTQVLVALMEQPQMMQNGQGGMPLDGQVPNGQNGGGQNPDANSSNSSDENQPKDPNGLPGSGRGFGGGKVTGETVTLTIPENTKISTMERGNGYGIPTEKQLSFSDIKIGQIMEVWYKEEAGDSKTIDHILIMQIPTQQQGGGNNTPVPTTKT